MTNFSLPRVIILTICFPTKNKILNGGDPRTEHLPLDVVALEHVIAISRVCFDTLKYRRYCCFLNLVQTGNTEFLCGVAKQKKICRK